MRKPESNHNRANAKGCPQAFRRYPLGGANPGELPDADWVTPFFKRKTPRRPHHHPAHVQPIPAMCLPTHHNGEGPWLDPRRHVRCREVGDWGELKGRAMGRSVTSATIVLSHGPPRHLLGTP